MKRFATLLFISIVGLGLTDRVIGQADVKPAPSPPNGSQKTGTAQDTVVPTINTVKVQKATVNPMGLSNPENVKTKPLMTPEQKEADKSRKKYEKSQKKAAKDAEKARKKAASQASKAHLDGH